LSIVLHDVASFVEFSKDHLVMENFV
jgi:hypothetical protein